MYVVGDHKGLRRHSRVHNETLAVSPRRRRQRPRRVKDAAAARRRHSALEPSDRPLTSFTQKPALLPVSSYTTT